MAQITSKVGSLENIQHTPKGGDKKIFSQKLDFSKVSSKVGSKDNLSHSPAGGDKKIITQKLEFKQKASPKIDAKVTFF
jgi:hypothetical protein